MLIDRKAQEKFGKRQGHREDLQSGMTSPIRGGETGLLPSEIHLSLHLVYVQPFKWTYCLNGDEPGSHHALSINQAFLSYMESDLIFGAKDLEIFCGSRLLHFLIYTVKYSNRTSQLIYFSLYSTICNYLQI